MNLMAKKLLIVDDRALARHLVRQAATTPLDTVLECASATDALKAVGAFQPDCVLMGVSIHAPGAFTAIKSIRKKHPEVRVLAVGSVNENEMRRAASAAGAAGYASTENLSDLFLLAAPGRLEAPPRRQLSRRQKK